MMKLIYGVTVEGRLSCGSCARGILYRAADACGDLFRKAL